MDSNLLIPTSGNGGFDWSSLGNQSILSQTLALNQNPVFYSEHAGSEFSSLNDFLSMIDDPSLVGHLDHTPLPPTSTTTGAGVPSLPPATAAGAGDLKQEAAPQPPQPQPSNEPVHGAANNNNNASSSSLLTSLREPSRDPSAGEMSSSSTEAKKDKFFLTAADPSEDISPEERLKQVIHAKVEAGLLQPFNYVKGYTRLQKYMDNYMNQSSKQRILKPLSIFRPAFRAVAQSLQDVDLVLVEEAFERMLLDYDRVFTSMAIPACLWRRTGEIYRGNKEFAGLVEVNVDDLRDGKLAIYELMSEESAVNYWEKYGNIAFDSGQKAVLTSCNLRTRDGRKRRACCFSFTVRRDRYNIPSCIVGNFIPIHP